MYSRINHVKFKLRQSRKDRLGEPSSGRAGIVGAVERTSSIPRPTSNQLGEDTG